MKFITLGLLATAALLLICAPSAQAGQYHVQIDTGGGGRGFKGSFGGVEVTVGRGKSRHDSCRIIHSVEVHRRTERRQTYDERGRLRTSRVTVVTYQDRYSNGSMRTYVRIYP